MGGMVLVVAWAVVVAATIWWWLAGIVIRESPIADGPRPDPHAGQVAAFRRQLHDWDRHGGLGT